MLKWLGGKSRLSGEIAKMLPPAKILVEPFVGSASVFLNTDYPEYILADINPHLIQLFQHIQEAGGNFIQEAKTLFTPDTNTRECYFALREEYNTTSDPWRKSLLFLYLSRHSFNGVYRENASGGYNVPFGRYKKPYFPEVELRYFHTKATARATFICSDFRKVMDAVELGSVVYVDPPYLPASETANFVSYTKGGFTLQDHYDLAQKCRELAMRGIPVLASNHDVPLVRTIYAGATIRPIEVARHVSQDTKNRMKAKEVLALMPPNGSDGDVPEVGQADEEIAGGTRIFVPNGN